MDAQEEHAMADHLTKKGPQDAARINLSEDFEVRYRSHKFGVTKMISGARFIEPRGMDLLKR